MNGEQQGVTSVSREGSMNVGQDNYVSIRLVPTRVVNQIELFLSNHKLVVDVDEKTGEPVERIVKFGEGLVNQEGVNSIMQMIEARINEHTVQGNMKEDEYGMFVSNVRKNLTDAIIMNAPYWEIKDSKIQMIIDTIMDFFKPFMSRTINNLERETLKPSMQSRETIVHNAPRRGPLQTFAGA